MSMLDRLKPKFWDHHDAAVGGDARRFDFRQKWKLIVLLTSIVTLTPLIIMTFIDYRITRRTMEEQLVLRTTKLLSNTWRTVSFFLTQRKSAMAFVLQDNTLDQLTDPARIEAILVNLQNSIGGFVDLAVVDANGRLAAYAGPHGLLKGVDFSGESCFRQVVKQGEYISHLDGEQPADRLVMAVRHPLPDGGFFVLRALLDAKPFYRLLTQLDLGELDDAFILDPEGRLQTPSLYHGRIHERIDLTLPDPGSDTRVIRTATAEGEPVILGYAGIPGSPFTLVVVRDPTALMNVWYKPRIQLVGFLILSIAAVLCAILGVATFLVQRIHTADQRRAAELHRVEYANKLTSIERLAAGLAHEINNPLAIIGEKAGLIRDLFHIRKRYAEDEKLIGLIQSILVSVERCGTITRRLLNFARHIEVTPQPVDVGDLIQGMVDFVARDAARMGIEIRIEMSDRLCAIQSDPSHLQQIFLNLLSNSFAAMKNGGRLEIRTDRPTADEISVRIRDTGCGIPEQDLKHIFEPFFTTKAPNVGTGLGLSITHGLVQQIGGKVSVQSQVGTGTCFTLTLPITGPPTGENPNRGRLEDPPSTKGVP